MKIRIKNELVEKIGKANLKGFNVSGLDYGIREHVDIDLAGLSKDKLGKLDDLLAAQPAGQSIKMLRNDITVWRESMTGKAGQQKARTVQAFQGLLTSYLAQSPGHRVMHKERGSNLWLSSYVNKIAYHEGDRRAETGPRVSVLLLNEEYGIRETSHLSFDTDDIRGKTVSQVMADRGIYPETTERRADYLRQIVRFTEVVKNVGKQYLATGTGDTSPDGNPKDQERESWYYRQSRDIDLVRNGGGDADRAKVEQFFWKNAAAGKLDDSEWQDDKAPQEPSAIADDDIEIPIHPFLVVFDLTKHLRLRVHIDQLTDYVYDQHLADKLILSAERKMLVQMLIDMRQGVFRDIVQGKGGGAVVLLAGAPGTGKTLTAEVYAEAESRPLYSVQCSQLGTDPDILEDALLKVFARSRRWQAVMLLDEADVYVHARGNDMQQNAIVGVFLRVLEYQASVLFLTTNRPDDVDDAIASRCIAKLVYQLPTQEEQVRIWQVLSSAAKIPISETTIARIVSVNTGLSGRDVKNLLKLASVVNSGNEVTADAVEFVKQFKPTGDVA